MIKSFFEIFPVLNEGGFDRDTRLLFLPGSQIEEARKILKISGASRWKSRNEQLEMHQLRTTKEDRTNFAQKVLRRASEKRNKKKSKKEKTDLIRLHFMGIMSVGTLPGNIDD